MNIAFFDVKTSKINKGLPMLIKFKDERKKDKTRFILRVIQLLK
jgi:hypothetical protein